METATASARHGQLDPDQITQLARALHPTRVITDAYGHSAVAGQDIVAHLTRIFGYGGWDRFERTEMLYCDQRAATGRWDCAYEGHVRLVIRNRRGETVCVLEGSNVGVATDLPRGEALRNAKTSAATLALKRAAMNLGDQFGLSLYNGGTLAPVVNRTLDDVAADRAARAEEAEDGEEVTDEPVDVQGSAPEQVADEMDGVNPASDAEMARMEAYQRARQARDGDDPPPVPADEEDRRVLLLAEVAFLDGLKPGLSTAMASRLAEADDLESASAEELLSLVGPMRYHVLPVLRKRGLHKVADHYQKAGRELVAPLAVLLGPDWAPDITGDGAADGAAP